MEKQRSSETAALAAISRAAHPLVDDEPWILEDPFAGPLVGLSDARSVLKALKSFKDKVARCSTPEIAETWIRSTRAIVTLRERYAEDQLAMAIERGLTQYVILGCGFDSFAYRRPDLAESVQIFEVDDSATQERKRTRLRELGLEIPSHVTLVPLDFEEKSLLAALQACGFQIRKPAFFSWLGATWHLTRAAINKTLGEIAGTATGSQIVIDYCVPREMLAEPEPQTVFMLEGLPASRAEHEKTYFAPEAFAALLRAFGFASVWHLGAEDANQRYLADRRDGLRFPVFVQLTTAQVGHQV